MQLMFWVGDITNNFNKKKTFLVLLLLIFSKNIFFAQTNISSPEDIDETAIVLNDESQIFLDGAQNQTENVTSNSPSGIWIFVRMILVLILVVVIILLVFRLMKKNMSPSENNDPFLRKVSSIMLSPGKSVQVVTIQEKAYIIGVTDNAVNLLGTIDGKASDDDREFINALNLYADKNENVKRPKSFADILDLFMPNGPRNFSPEKKSANIFSENADKAVEMLKKQRSRLNEENEETEE